MGTDRPGLPSIDGLTFDMAPDVVSVLDSTRGSCKEADAWQT